MLRRIRALADFLAFAFAVYAMLATTPLGALAVGTARRLIWGTYEARPLVSYFDTSASDAREVARRVLPPRAIAERPDLGSPTSTAAIALGMRPALARALLVMAAESRLDEAGDLAVTIPDTARDSFAAVGLMVPPVRAPAAIRQGTLLRGVARLGRRLGSDEAAVAALKADYAAVEHAIDRARAQGAPEPLTYAGFRPFIPPEDRRRIDPFLHGVFALGTAYDMTAPLAVRAALTSPFGERVHPVLKTRRLHTGVDLAVVTGTPIRAVAPGVVVHATEDSVNGKFVKIAHGHGLSSAYCHASKLSVASGDRVSAGEEVALSGSTGRSTGPHLHFQVEIDGKPIDPELFLILR